MSQSASYDDVLVYALGNEKIKNIAVTGPYGSGKSSILKTFEKEHKEYKYLNISLASFNEEHVSVTSSDGGNVSQEHASKVKNEERRIEESRLIELSILQQMFYKVKDADIPDSRFKRIQSLSTKRIVINTILVLLLILGLSLIFQPAFFNRLSWWKHVDKDRVWYTSIILVIPATVQLVVSLFRLFNTSRFNRLNLSSGEIEINPKSETSILNKHLDEILYFFEVTAFNVVVIEDLDRFNDPEIFTKLRELNILVNNSSQINRRVVFIYAIKDDLFVDKTRTKFFDFIIPVIPIINSSNSYEIMLRKVQQPELGLSISESFLGDITLYIDDMRALKNIFNEFILYRENLKGISIKDDKLFAIIVYKNIYPNDFASLHENSGVVFSAFESKSRLLENIIRDREQQIEGFSNRIHQINEISLKNLEELRSLYVLELINSIPRVRAIHLAGLEVGLKNLTEDKYFTQLKKQTNITFYQHNDSYQRSSSVSFAHIEKETDKDHTYEEREALMIDRVAGETAGLKKRIGNLKSEISNLYSLSLKSLMERLDSPLDHFDVSLKEKKLLVYLIREGYIDEMYPSLISYFHEGSLSKKDMVFLMSIKDREPLAFDYTLEKFDSLVTRLTIEEFKRSEILNIDLTNFLMTHAGAYEAQLNEVFFQLRKGTGRSVSFVDEYIIKGKQIPSFIRQLCKSWEGVADFYFIDSNYSEEKKNRLLQLILRYADLPDIDAINKNGILSNYISHKADFLPFETDPAYIEKVEQVLKMLNVKFKGLIYEQNEASSQLFDYVYENYLYSINHHMIELIVRLRSKEDEAIGSIKSANYTSVRQSGCSKLISYVEANISLYVDNIILDNHDNINDSEEAVIALLNNKALSTDQKERIIDQETVLVEDILQVNPELWVKLFESDKLAISWYNIVEYFNSFKDTEEPLESFNDTLVAYLNRKTVFEKLAKSRLDSENDYPKELFYKLSRSLILCEKILNESYVRLVESLPYHYPKGVLAFQNLSEAKIGILIENLTIPLDSENFSLLKEHYQSKHVSLIEKNIKVYLSKPEEYILEADDYLLLLNSSKLDEKHKLNIALEISDEQFTQKRELATLAGSLMAKAKLNSVKYSTLKLILTYSKNSHDCVMLLDLHLHNLNLNEAEELLSAVGEPYDAINERGRRPTLPGNSVNLSIAEKLRNKGYISSYKEEKGRIRVITKSR